MTVFFQFAILGLGAGAAYTLLAQGIVLVHRGSGVVNFAHGAMAMVGAYVYYDLNTKNGWSEGAAIAGGVATVIVLGVAVYWLIMRPLRSASPATAAIATLGLFILLQGVSSLHWGTNTTIITQFLPENRFEIADVSASADRLILLGIAATLTLVLWAVSRFTAIGLALRANAENRRVASALGWSPDSLGVLTWGVGSGLAGLAGILIAPLTGISGLEMPLLVIPALAAAFIGGFSSFPWTFVGALGVGIGQAEIGQYLTWPGVVQALPFLVILVLLVIRGKGLPSRGQIAETLPELGSGRAHPLMLVGVALIGGFLLHSVLQTNLVIALTSSLCWAFLLLSLVVLLGYAGQLSLGQFALAGIGALIAGQLVSNGNVPFEAALPLGVLLTIPAGLVFALPALRARGINLAVVTLGLGVTVNAMVFNNGWFTGGYAATIDVGMLSFFGLGIDQIRFPERYAVFVFVLFLLCCYAIGSLRRGVVGRRLIAVRTNERAAAALGVNVLGAKLYAFAVASALAGLGGILLAFRNPYVTVEDFVPFASIEAVGYSVIGGVGYITGAPLGSGLAPGGLGAWIMNELFPGTSTVWLTIIGGATVIALVIFAPDGLVRRHQLPAAVKKKLSLRRADARTPPSDQPTPERVVASTLEIEDLVVRFGGVTAVNGATFAVRPGEIVALIGPNGAGKTTVIDALTGYVRPASGEIRKDGVSIVGLPVHRRAWLGVGRSFQSLELFESNTVRENLQVASDPRGWTPYLTDLVVQRERPLSPAALAAVKALELTEYLDERVSDLPYGRRRLVAIARAIAMRPSILLLDEPAAGLSDVETADLAKAVRALADEWGLSILVVEHDMSFVMGISDRVEVLDFGRHIASGTPAEICRNEIVIAAYLGGPAVPPELGGVNA